MKNQALFSSKYKSKKIKYRLLQYLFGALRVKCTLLREGRRIPVDQSVSAGDYYFSSLSQTLIKKIVQIMLLMQ